MIYKKFGLYPQSLKMFPRHNGKMGVIINEHDFWNPPKDRGWLPGGLTM